MTVTVNDGVASGSNSTCLTVNGAPTINAGGPYSGYEGSYVTLHATTSDPDDDPSGVSWTFTKVADPGTTCTTAYTTTLTPKIKCTDDAVVTATLRVNDGVNPVVIKTTTITFLNKAPTIGTVDLPDEPGLGRHRRSASRRASPTRVATTRTPRRSPGVTARRSGGVIDEDDGSGTATGTHAYSAPGAYHGHRDRHRRRRRRRDRRLDQGDRRLQHERRVRDRWRLHRLAGGLVHAGELERRRRAGPGELRLRRHGPASGRHRPATRSSSSASASRIRTHDSNDDDDDEHDSWRERDRRGHDDGWDDSRFSTTNLDFHSTVVHDADRDSGSTKAIFKGTGTVNGVSGYSFLVSVIDGRNSGNDKFRIKIWNTSTGVVLYDNQAGAADDANADDQRVLRIDRDPLAGGSQHGRRAVARPGRATTSVRP